MGIPARLGIVTLGVADLAASAAFYERWGWSRSEQSSDAIVWFVLGGTALGLFPRAALADDAGLPDDGTGFTRTTLAVNAADESSVDDYLAIAVAAGADLVKPAQRADWGGYHGYVADPDGHHWEIAFNPYWQLRDGLPVL